MVEDDTFKEVAATDFKLKIIFGFIFGILAFIASVIFIIVGIVSKKYEAIAPISIMALVGILVSVSCGYFLFRKEKKQDEQNKEE